MSQGLVSPTINRPALVADLQAAMRAQGITAAELSRQTGIPRPVLSNALGKQRCDAGVWLVLCAWLGTDPFAFVTPKPDWIQAASRPVSDIEGSPSPDLVNPHPAQPPAHAVSQRLNLPSSRPPHRAQRQAAALEGFCMVLADEGAT